ncbi:GNAT family N-acetyltransferase [Arthrobacter sp.]|uniref:GNAT family N-acetyltransferase n=1 Tax=Arthrobacter sp. TaxID=1667 RepID=UPI002810EBF9|nr:GNAT family N-acetyltransferase [Arthrobacter sp.]
MIQGGTGPLSVRQAGPKDAEELSLVHVLSWKETYAGVLSDGFLAGLNPTARLEMWKRILEGPRVSDHWVACDADRIVGFAGREQPEQQHPGQPALLWGLYVLQSHQCLGLGRKLLEAALGDGPASLWVAAQNERAIAFYRRFGFQPDGAEDAIAEWENLKTIRMVR